MLSKRFKRFGIALAMGASLLTTLFVATPASAATSVTMGGGIAGIQNCDGRWEEFALTTSTIPIHRWQLSPGGAWSDWVDMNGSLRYGISVVRNTNCTLELFGIGAGNLQMYHTWQSPSSPGGWSGWASLGGVLTGAPNASNLWDGRVEVCAYGPDNVYHCTAQTAPSSGPWTGWY
ncbi:hypothetical protein [Actinokineospora sp. HUAS TT18]|uniref:hypothetical protein n=1 Tax=Actinokineospora sp. HUAS TT18 TaxID=3447451 RepID=UPI003F528987